MVEEQLDQEGIQNKYMELKSLSEFLQAFDTNVFTSAKKKAKKRESTLHEVLNKQFAFGTEDTFPIMDSSDEDLAEE